MTALFENIFYALPERLKTYIRSIKENDTLFIEEIRLRKDKPLALTVKGKTYFVNTDSELVKMPKGHLIYITPSEITETLDLLCEYSHFAHEGELKDGYIMLKNGCRAGVCGKYNDDGLLCEATSVNIRIAREVIGCANKLSESYNLESILIAGPPGSGKTTLLRDLLRQLSSGKNTPPLRVAVIDSRGELSNLENPDALGLGTDVIICREKAKGIEIAVRTMFPEIVAFDEIGTENELKLIEECFFSGVSVITTAHAGSIEELKKRKLTKSLLESGVFSKIAFLNREKELTVKSVSG